MFQTFRAELAHVVEYSERPAVQCQCIKRVIMKIWVIKGPFLWKDLKKYSRVTCIQGLLLWHLGALFSLDFSSCNAQVTLDPLEVRGLLEEGTKGWQYWLLVW